MTCEFACDDAEAILSLAEDFGRIAADLWFDGKLDALTACEEPPDADED